MAAEHASVLTQSRAAPGELLLFDSQVSGNFMFIGAQRSGRFGLNRPLQQSQFFESGRQRDFDGTDTLDRVAVLFPGLWKTCRHPAASQDDIPLVQGLP